NMTLLGCTKVEDITFDRLRKV
ncbi:uncharacterized protein METZ01_LOCUS496980, partial [marine metagenome]